MKRLLGILGSLALLALAIGPASVIAAPLPPVSIPLTCASGSTYVESRAWWTPSGTSFDAYRGIDGGICLSPAAISGTVTIPLHLGLRHNPGTIDEITVYLADTAHPGGVRVYHQTGPLLTGTSSTNVRRDIAITINSEAIGTGWKELRVQTRMTHDSDNGVLAFATTGWQLNVRGGSTTYRHLPWTETRSWYSAAGPYVHARFLSPLPVAAKTGSWSFTVAFPEGHGHVYVDGDTFADPMIFPLTLACTTSCTLDTTRLADGPHYLLLRSDRAQSGGTSSALEYVAFKVANGQPAPSPSSTPTAVPTPAPSACR